jgi:hypothetical protein|nr:MAG TPA: Nucleotide modification associated domain 1 [Caudoviricetes sp.]
MSKNFFEPQGTPFDPKPSIRLEDLECTAVNDPVSFGTITKQMEETYEAKNADYGNSFDKSLDKYGIIGALVRMSDKMNRLDSLVTKEARVKDESLEDTLLDLANYAIMTVMWMRKQ